MMNILPLLVQLLLFKHPIDINWAEYWVGVAIGWLLLIGVFAYVIVIVHQEKK